MPKKKLFLSPLIIFSIIIQFFFSSSLGEGEFNIPSEYVTDSSFLSMITKKTIPLNVKYASPKGSGSL